MNITKEEREKFWPSLPFAEWKETAATLHMWTQIVGKIRLTQTPWTNHSWHVTLYLTARGLTTSPVPHGLSTFEISFDFIHHQLRIDGSDRARSLRARGEQSRLLAGRRSSANADILFVRISGTIGICAGKGAAGRCILQSSAARIHFTL